MPPSCDPHSECNSHPMFRAPLALRSIIVCLPFLTGLPANAQPTIGTLTSVVMVVRPTDATHGESGTMFRVVIDNREYWITARHVVTGVYGETYGKLEGPTVKMRALVPAVAGPVWKEEMFSIIDLGDETDILALYTRDAIEDAPDSGDVLASTGVLVGGQCEFLGFPFGLGVLTELEGRPIASPFVKHCFVSARLKRPPIWYLDGINNHGFSGGPVVFWDGSQQKIMAVISGYMNEDAPVTVAPLRPNAPGGKASENDTPQRAEKGVGAEKSDALVGTAQTNSGLILAFDIGLAVDAIKQNPVGPLLKATP
jgi:hypothetical protein